MPRYIQVRTSFQGLHEWPSAPDEVAFLRNLHRHVFNVEVCIQVSHADRDIEFFMLKAVIDRLIAGAYPSYHENQPTLLVVGQRSCEQIAEDIWDGLINLHGIRIESIIVREDDENAGAIS